VYQLEKITVEKAYKVKKWRAHNSVAFGDSVEDLGFESMTEFEFLRLAVPRSVADIAACQIEITINCEAGRPTICVCSQEGEFCKFYQIVCAAGTDIE